MAETETNYRMAPPPQPVKRMGTGFRAILQLVFGFLSLVFVYYLALNYHTRKDLTADGRFTLSERTDNLLASSPLQERDEPVKIIAAMRKTSPHYPRLQPVIDEYQRLSKGKVVVEHLDPIRDGNRALEIQNNYGGILPSKLFEEDIFIIDARTGSDANSIEPSISVASHLRYLPVSELVVSRDVQVTKTGKKVRQVIGYQDEDLITSMIQSAVEGLPRIMYLVQDKSDLEVTAAGSPLQVITEALIKQNILLRALNISQVDKIPDDAEGLVIVAPEYDFEPKDIQVLEDFWNRPSSSIITYLNPASRLVNLNAFLRQNGVTPRDDRIIRTRNGRTESQVLATFTSGAGLGVNGSLESKSVAFDGRVGSLEVREGAEDLALKRIQPYSLIEAAPGFWGETSYRKANPKYDDDSDYSAPLAIGAAVIRGNANSDNTAPDISKMVVLSTSDFLEPRRLGNEQLDFIKNSTDWLLGREELIGIGPRAIQMRKLNLIKEEVGFMSNVIIFFIPAGFFLLAMFVWNARRA